MESFTVKAVGMMATMSWWQRSHVDCFDQALEGFAVQNNPAPVSTKNRSG